MLRTGRSLLISFLIGVVAVLGCLTTYAQKTTIYTTPYADFNLAMELFDKEKYGAAQQYFDKVIDAFSAERSEVGISARYYSALCALNLFHNNAEKLLIQFTIDYPENPKTKVANFQLGNYWFRKKRYKTAIEWFEKVSVYELENEEIAAYYFKYGYAFFMEERNEEALMAFYEIKDVDTRFTSMARYYYAHLSYLNKKYETALIEFKKIEHNEKFQGIVPYYITQIYFLQEKYDSLLSYAPSLLDSANTKRAPEIARLIGEAYYHTEQFEEAIPYLERYLDDHAVLAGDAYQLGYANYKAARYKEAIGWFERATDAKDSLSQLSYYHMAECYLSLGNKIQARNSLNRAASMDFDNEVKENALFSYAKLAYELSYHPYDDAIQAFERYINTYPNSARIDKAHEYLIGVYYTTKNYKEALLSLNRITQRNYKLDKAYQKVAYFRGVELFNERHYEDAIVHFDLSLEKNIDPEIGLSCLYWKAEAWYRIYKFDEAVQSYQEYLASAGAIRHPYYEEAYYGEGYAQYRKKNYPAAITALRNYIRIEKNQASVRRSDALLRIGDCYFINRQYEEAIEYYDKAVLSGRSQTDYALYQSGVANGVINNREEKANLLLTLVESYRESPYRDDALFELGGNYIGRDNTKALTYYNKLSEEYPNSNYESKTLLKRGLIYYNEGDDQKALQQLREVVLLHKSTPEAQEAIAKIQQIFTNQGNMKGLEDFLKETPGIDIKESSIDSARYQIAENHYMNGNCEEAVKNFTHYLERDSLGVFELNARFYRAECEYKSEYLNEALLDYQFVLDKAVNKFTETALQRAAKLRYGLGQYNESKETYLRLLSTAEQAENIDLAQYMLVKLSAQLEDYENVIKYGQAVMKQPKAATYIQEEVGMLMAMAYQKQDDYNRAFDLYLELSDSQTEYGAQAKYEVAFIEYLRGNYDSCETWVLRLINHVPAYDYWIAKGFLLLADKYVVENDFFQAKYSLQSVIDNYEGEELREIAQSKLQVILNREATERKAATKKKEVLLIDHSDHNYDDLFEEEIIEEETVGEKNTEEKNDAE
jgi:tetratricopeptide (TPR) repeat protein